MHMKLRSIFAMYLFLLNLKYKTELTGDDLKVRNIGFGWELQIFSNFLFVSNSATSDSAFPVLQHRVRVHIGLAFRLPRSA